MVLEAIHDIDARLLPQHYKSAMARSPNSGQPGVPLSESQAAEVTRLLHTDLPTAFARIERVLTSTDGPWFCSHRLTVCDLACFVVVRGFEDGTYVAGIERSVLAGCPALRQHAIAVAELSAVQKWIVARADS